MVLLPLNAAIRAATEELERSWALALAALAPPAIRVLFRGGGPGTVFLLKMEDDDVVFDLNNIPLFLGGGPGGTSPEAALADLACACPM